jgi:hypothetical protein
MFKRRSRALAQSCKNNWMRSRSGFRTSEGPDAGRLINVAAPAAQRAFTITNGRTRRRYEFAVK